MMIPKMNRQFEIGLVVVILLIAAVLRMHNPELTEFKADEARLLSLSWEMAEGNTFPLRGISSSVGIPNFPTSVWIYALPLAIWPHVFAPTLFTGVLNTIAVGLCYWLVRRYWGWRAAVAATLMFAVSPWAIVHARKIWAQNLISIFVLGWGISGLLAFVEDRKKWLMVHLVCAAVAFQIHLAAVSLLVGSAVSILVYWRRFSWRWLIGGAVASAVTAAPFAYYAAFLSQKSLFEILESSGGGSSAGFSLNGITHAFRLYSGWQIHALTGGEAFERFLDQIGPLVGLPWVWLLFALLGLYLLVSQAKISDSARFVLIWLVCTIGTFLWFPTAVELHYLLPTYPVLFIAAGVGIDWLLDRFKPIAVWGVLGGTVVGQAAVWLMLISFVANQATPGGFGDLLRDQLEMIDVAQEWVENGDANEVLVWADGENPEQDNVAAIYALHLRDVPHRFVSAQHSALFPADRTVLLKVVDDAPLEPYVAMEAVESAVVARRPGEADMVAYLLPAAVEPELANRFEPVPLLANWVNFLAYQLGSESSEQDWLVSWRVGAPAPTDYHFFNHLQDRSGQRLAQADETAFSAGQWREGDIVLSYFPMGLSDG